MFFAGFLLCFHSVLTVTLSKNILKSSDRYVMSTHCDRGGCPPGCLLGRMWHGVGQGKGSFFYNTIHTLGKLSSSSSLYQPAIAPCIWMCACGRLLPLPVSSEEGGTGEQKTPSPPQQQCHSTDLFLQWSGLILYCWHYLVQTRI